MKRTTSFQATFGTSTRFSEGGSAILWLGLQHVSLRAKIDRRPARRRAKPGYADRCSPNVAARETHLPGLRLWSVQFLRRFFQAHQLILCALLFESPTILSPLFSQLRHRVDRRH